MRKTLILKNCVIADSEIFIENGELVISDGKIVSGGENRASENDSTAEEIDLGGRLLLPGFVNPHTHLYSSLSTGLSPLGPTGSFREVLSNFWWPLDAAHDRDSVYYSALSGVLDAIRHGVTCIFDHHASMTFTEGSLSVIEKALRIAGIKAVLCFEASDRGPSALTEHIDENISFIDSHADDPLIRGMFGLHANFTLCGDSMKRIAGSIKNYGKPAPIHVHCGESESDLDFCVKDGYSGPVERLESFGLLAGDSILAHCIHLSGRDVDILSEKRPFIVSNPESNANNRVGRPERSRFPSYLIGTDGMSFDMVSSLRSQYLMGGGLSEDFGGLFNAFFTESRRLRERFFPDTGRIAAGKDADIAVLDYVPVTPVSRDNLTGHLIFGAKGGNVFMTISSGNILYKKGDLTFLYEKAVTRQIKEAAERLHRRYYG